MLNSEEFLSMLLDKANTAVVCIKNKEGSFFTARGKADEQIFLLEFMKKQILDGYENDNKEKAKRFCN